MRHTRLFSLLIVTFSVLSLIELFFWSAPKGVLSRAVAESASKPGV